MHRRNDARTMWNVSRRESNTPTGWTYLLPGFILFAAVATVLAVIAALVRAEICSVGVDLIVVRIARIAVHFNKHNLKFYFSPLEITITNDQEQSEQRHGKGKEPAREWREIMDGLNGW